MTINLVRLSPSSALPRLLCLPYAGGRSDFYRRWVPDLMGVLEVWTVDLHARQDGADLSIPVDLGDLVTDLTDATAALLDRPVTIFGHSMGALLGIEVVRRQERSGPPLRALTVSGCIAPQLWPVRAEPRHRGDDELVALLRDWDGTPAELLADREFLDLALPALRADLHLCDQFRDRPGRVRTALMAFAGSTDTTAPAVDVDAWSACTKDWRGLRTLPGGHFFVHSGRRAILTAITEIATDGACSP